MLFLDARYLESLMQDILLTVWYWSKKCWILGARHILLTVYLSEQDLLNYWSKEFLLTVWYFLRLDILNSWSKTYSFNTMIFLEALRPQQRIVCSNSSPFSPPFEKKTRRHRTVFGLSFQVYLQADSWIPINVILMNPSVSN